MQETLIILKPDTIQRGLVGRVLTRFEEKGIEVAAMKLMSVPKVIAEKHYAVHAQRPFYPSLISYIQSGPVVVAVLRGVKVIDVARKLMGKTFGFDAEPGTIRGDFSNSKSFNLIHGSDSPESAAFEIGLWFKPEEVTKGDRVIAKWQHGPEDVA
jgi:nucleoside-diphosphate kinase